MLYYVRRYNLIKLFLGFPQYVPFNPLTRIILFFYHTKITSPHFIYIRFSSFTFWYLFWGVWKMQLKILRAIWHFTVVLVMVQWLQFSVFRKFWNGSKNQLKFIRLRFKVQNNSHWIHRNMSKLIKVKASSDSSLFRFLKCSSITNHTSIMYFHKTMPLYQLILPLFARKLLVLFYLPLPNKY
jgi:hypothetical protein